MNLKLHGYWRSSASYRVRIALYLKELDFEYRAVHLVKEGGEQKKEAYKKLNPAALVPTLEVNAFKLSQSWAILEYLESLQPEPALLPQEPHNAALVRMLALDLAADLQPITNLRVLQYLTAELGVSEQAKTDWIHHWVKVSFTAFEAKLKQTAGQYCFGDKVTLADVCLVPQVYNAKRFQVNLSAYPILTEIAERLEALPAFQKAHPERQPDAQ